MRNKILIGVVAAVIIAGVTGGAIAYSNKQAEIADYNAGVETRYNSLEAIVENGLKVTSESKEDSISNIQKLIELRETVEGKSESFQLYDETYLSVDELILMIDEEIANQQKMVLDFYVADIESLNDGEDLSKKSAIEKITSLVSFAEDAEVNREWIESYEGEQSLDTILEFIESAKFDYQTFVQEYYSSKIADLTEEIDGDLSKDELNDKVDELADLKKEIEESYASGFIAVDEETYNGYLDSISSLKSDCNDQIEKIEEEEAAAAAAAAQSSYSSSNYSSGNGSSNSSSSSDSSSSSSGNSNGYDYPDGPYTIAIEEIYGYDVYPDGVWVDGCFYTTELYEKYFG